MPARYPLLLMSLIALAFGASGCASGFFFVAKNTPPHVSVGALHLSVTKIQSPYGVGFAVDVVVKNVSERLAWFDPAEVRLRVPGDAREYVHNNKQMTVLTKFWGFTPGVWDQANLACANPLPPGGTYAATLWFESRFAERGKIEGTVSSVNISYADQTLRFPQ